MVYRLLIGMALAALVVLVLAIPALAGGGGHVHVALDRAVTDVRSGTPFDVGFTVKEQELPKEGITPKLVFTHQKSGRTATVMARPEGPAGHYVATVTLPQDGAWAWTIFCFRGVNTMPPIQVGLSTPGATAQHSVPAVLSTPGATAQHSIPAVLSPAWIILAAFVTGSVAGMFGLLSVQRAHGRRAAPATAP